MKLVPPVTAVSYMEKDSEEEHLRAIRSENIITADMVDCNGKVKCMVHQSSSQYGDIRSSINHVYILTRVQMKERTRRELSIFIAGMEIIVIVEKQMLGIKSPEGKELISLEAYELLAKTLFDSGGKRDIFAHLFLFLYCVS